MLFEWMLGSWLLLLDWLIRLAALLWIPARTTPGAARSWLLLVGFVPLLGLPLYLLFGHPWLSAERLRRQAEASQVIREEQALQAALRWQPDADTTVAEMVPLVERQGDFMPVHGNALDLLTGYDDSLAHLIADIDQAEERVHLLYYLMFDDAVGQAIVEALQRAAARGVHCRLLLDAVGAKRGLRAYRKRLMARDIDVRAMLPGGLRWRRSGRMDLRNHRKIAVIDNKVGYIGSQNLADAGFVRGRPNRELVARVRGPAVAHLVTAVAALGYGAQAERIGELETVTPAFSGRVERKGEAGAVAVLHTHSRRLDLHPHVHLVMPGASLDARSRRWRTKSGYLFSHKALAKVFRATFLAAADDLQALKADFQFSSEPEQGGLHWVRATPVQRDGPVRSVMVGLRANAAGPELAVLDVQDSLGQRSLLTFSAFELNPALPANTFAFKPPAGVDVIKP